MWAAISDPVDDVVKKVNSGVTSMMEKFDAWTSQIAYLRLFMQESWEDISSIFLGGAENIITIYDAIMGAGRILGRFFTVDFVNFFIEGWNNVVDEIQAAVNRIVDSLNKLIQEINELNRIMGLFKRQIPLIQPIRFDGARGQLRSAPEITSLFSDWGTDMINQLRAVTGLVLDNVRSSLSGGDVGAQGSPSGMVPSEASSGLTSQDLQALMALLGDGMSGPALPAASAAPIIHIHISGNDRREIKRGILDAFTEVGIGDELSRKPGFVSGVRHSLGGA